DDRPCKLLLAELLAPHDEPRGSPEPAFGGQNPGPGAKRRSSGEPTPLPQPMPHHVADPSHQRISASDVTDPDADLPASEGATTGRGAGEGPSVAGLAQPARPISGLFATETARVTPFEDLAGELDTRQRPRVESDQVRRVALPPPTSPTDKVEL